MPIWSASFSDVRLFGRWTASLRRRRRDRHRLARVVGQHAGGQDAQRCSPCAIDMRSAVWFASACAISWPMTCASSSSVGSTLLDQPGVDRHAAAGHAPGVDGLRVVDDLHAPLPLRAVGPHLDGLRHEPLGDHFDAVQQPLVGDQLALLLVLAHLLRISLARGADRLLLGHEHQLRAARWGSSRSGGDQQRARQASSGLRKFMVLLACRRAKPRMMHCPAAARPGRSVAASVRPGGFPEVPARPPAKSLAVSGRVLQHVRSASAAGAAYTALSASAAIRPA